jgi:glycosyltransferase involved in cell wall biosynthesis
VTLTKRDETRPLRVLWATDRIGYGNHLHGPGRRLLTIAPRIDPAVAQIVACVLRADDPELSRLFAERGIPLRHLGKHRLDPTTVPKLLSILRRERIDLVHLTGYGASNFGRIAAGMLGIPSIVHVTDHYYPWYQRVADRLLAPWTTAVVTVSHSVARTSPMFRSPRLQRCTTVIHNAIDLEEFAPAEPDAVRRLRASLQLEPQDLVVGYVGRLHPEKGVHHLVEAAPAILAAEPRARLLLVGDGPQRAELEQRVAELGLGERVSLRGFEADVASMLSVLDVAVFPSLTEGFPNVVLEAMAVGKPVVASDVEGIAELLDQGETGLLVPPADPPALASAVLRLLAQPEERARLAANARRASRAYGIERHVAALETLYRRVAAEGRAS